MKIEDNRPIETKTTVGEIEIGDPFMYIGRFMIKTGECRKLSNEKWAFLVTDLFSGTVHELKEDDKVLAVKAKVIIES